MRTIKIEVADEVIEGPAEYVLERMEQLSAAALRVSREYVAAFDRAVAAAKAVGYRGKV